MASIKHNWDALFEDYKNNHESSGTSVSAYAKLKDLPAGSCRRAFKKLKEADHNGDHNQELITSKQKGDRSSKPNKKQNKKKSDQPNNTRADWGLRGKSAIASGKSESGQVLSTAKKLIGRPSEDQDGAKNANHSHGGCIPYINMPVEVKEAVESMAIGDISPARMLIAAQMVNVERIVNDLSLKIINQYQDEPLLDDNGIEIPVERELGRVRLPAADVMGRLVTSFANITDKDAKRQREETKLQLELDEREEKKQIKERQLEILAVRKDKELSAMDTAALMEAEGLPLTPYLAKEVDYELANQQPEDNDGGLTEEEMDELEQAYVEKTLHYAEHVAPDHIAGLMDTLQELEERGNQLLGEEEFAYEPPAVAKPIPEEDEEAETSSFGSENLDGLEWNADEVPD